MGTMPLTGVTLTPGFATGDVRHAPAGFTPGCTGIGVMRPAVCGTGIARPGDMPVGCPAMPVRYAGGFGIGVIRLGDMGPGAHVPVDIGIGIPPVGMPVGFGIGAPGIGTGDTKGGPDMGGDWGKLTGECAVANSMLGDWTLDLCGFVKLFAKLLASFGVVGEVGLVEFGILLAPTGTMAGMGGMEGCMWLGTLCCGFVLSFAEMREFLLILY